MSNRDGREQKRGSRNVLQWQQRNGKCVMVAVAAAAKLSYVDSSLTPLALQVDI